MKTISPAEAAEMLKTMNIPQTQAIKYSEVDEDIDWDDDEDVLESPCESKVPIKPPSTEDETLIRISKLLHPQTKTNLHHILHDLRLIILSDGIPIEEISHHGDETFLRGNVWKLFLGVVSTVSAQEYADLISKGPSPMADKIRRDVGRTFKNDTKFCSRVSAAKLTRILNAFAWKTNVISDETFKDGMIFSYVQGMNIIAGMFLYVMSELDAFYCFHSFIVNYCPSFMQPNMEGVHENVQLFDDCLKLVDPELHLHLSQSLHPKTYSFAPLLTFGACTPPLDQAVLIWDFLLAFGLELNVLQVIAQITLIKQKLMHSKTPMTYLRTLPDLRAKEILQQCLKHVEKVPPKMFQIIHKSFIQCKKLSA